MNEKQDRPYVCSAPGCSQCFQLEEHLIIHRHKHEMTLKFPSIKTDRAFADQTPTPTRFLQNCDEVGLFKEIEEEFLQAEEEEKSKQVLSHNGASCINQHQLKPQLQLQHPPKLQHPHPQPLLHHPQTQPLQHPQSHGSLMGLSCSLAVQQALPSSQSGSVSTLTHSGPVPESMTSLLHRHRQPLPASLPGTLPDPAMQGASAQHVSHLGRSHSHQLHQSGNVPIIQAHHSPPSHLHQHSPPAPPLTVPAQLSPVAQQMQPSQPSHSQHAVQAGGSCSGGAGGAGGGGSRRRRVAEQDPDERRQKFLERNRAAATRCRQKRKLWVSSLEKKAEELTHTNLQLQNEVTSLRSEVGQLKQILLTHQDCPVTAQQREAQGYTTAGVSPGGSPTPVDPRSHQQAIHHNSISTSSTDGGDTGQNPQPGC
uniref:cyclic AMP-responsive element-binding protein 5-like isoform X2 n=1 Tax=Monopterus albus TaxID=43700 RepID=UPI0009B3AA17|nr:cyclic AMP-responsive element-binding protein 5-like isoform X2 [Monopterus albus]